MYEEIEYDYYVEKPNDLMRLGEMEGWEIEEGEPDIRGWDIVDEENNTIGKIDDLMVSEEANAAIMTLVSCGGFWGMGEKQTLVPVDRFDLDLDNHKAIFIGNRDDLRDAPEYREDMSNFTPFYDYWLSKEEAAEEEEVMLADIQGWDVADRDGNSIGRIDDVIEDENTDRGPLAVVSFGPAWDMETTRTLIPLEVLVFDTDSQRAFLPGSADDMRNSPEYTGETHHYAPFYDHWGISEEEAAA